MVCRDFILPEPASYVFFYAVFNLRKLLYIILMRLNRRVPVGTHGGVRGRLSIYESLLLDCSSRALR